MGITSVLASFTDAFSISASNKTVAVLMENTTSMKEEIQEVIVILFCLKNKQKQKPVINFKKIITINYLDQLRPTVGQSLR